VDNLVGTFEAFLDEVAKTDVHDLQGFLNDSEPYFHDSHYLRCLAKRYIIQNQADPLLRVRLCEALLRLFDCLDKGWSQSRGLTLVELIKAKLALHSRLGRDEQLDETRRIREMAEEARQCLGMECQGSLSQVKLTQMENALKDLFASRTN
jgi:hypothetical protein